MALLIGALIGVLGTAGVIGLSRKMKASKTVMAGDSKPPAWVTESLPNLPLEEQVSLIPDTPYFNPNDMVHEEKEIPDNFDDFAHLERIKKQGEAITEEVSEQQQPTNEFVDSDLDKDTVMFAEKLGIDLDTSSPEQPVVYEELNDFNRSYMDDEGEEEMDCVDYDMSDVIIGEAYDEPELLPNHVVFQDSGEEIKKVEMVEAIQSNPFVFHIEEEESITYYEELENEMKDYSHGTVDSITLEKDALKVTELAENPFGILGLNKPVIEPKAEEVIENKEEEKDFLQVMHSTFLEGKVEGDYDKLAHIQPVFPTLDEYERGMLNRYNQIDKEYGEIISHKIIDDEYGTQTWVCEIKGIEDTYLHVYDGTARAWLNVENFISKQHEIGSIIMVEVCRDFTGRYEVLTFSTLEGPEQDKGIPIQSIEAVSLGIEELQVKQNFIL